MFTSVVGPERKGPFRTFQEAFGNFLPCALLFIAHGDPREIRNAPLWIEGKFMGTDLPMCYEDARDLAYRLGILDGRGLFRNPPPDVEPEVIENAFLENAIAKLDTTTAAEVRQETNAKIGAVHHTRP
jgi:hypothetical protein